ncbi:MAG: DUF3450 domain-containing protein [Gammaproteobacteria bacterium]
MRGIPRNIAVLASVLGAMFAAELASAQAVERIVAVEARRIQQAQAAQDQIDGIIEITREKVDEYRALLKEIDGLVVYNTLLDRQIADQERELSTLSASIDQVSVIERQVLPLLTRMIEGLERFVSLDVPFLAAERTDRAAGLRNLLERSDVTSSEKFRVVMEAWQIENEYGRTIEAYSDQLQINGTNREVDMLRIGRVVLAYQTPDGALSGVWDQANRQWVPLGNEHRNSIRQGLRIARNQLSADILLLPVAPPEEG